MNNTKQNQVALVNYAKALYKIALTFFICGILIAVPLVVRSPSDAVLAFLGVGCLAMVVIPVFLWKDFDIFEPLSFIILMVSMGIAFKLIYILGFRDRHYVIQRLLLGGSPDEFLYGSFAVFTGIAFLMAGYWRRSTRLPIDFLFFPKFSNWNQARMRIVCVIILVIAGISFVLFAQSIGVSLTSIDSLSSKRFIDMTDASRSYREERIQSSSYYFYRIAAFSKFVMYLSLAWLMKAKRKWLSMDGVIIVWAILQTAALSFVMQSRASLALILLDSVILTYYSLKYIPLKKVMVFGAVVFAILLVQLQIRDKNEHKTFLDVVEKTVAGRDIMDISKTCHIINAVPERMEFCYGETLFGWLAAPIPRSIWPDKPLWAEKGVYVFQRVFNGRNSFTGMTLGLMAELYWNFGWLGICIGSYLIGAFLRNMYSAFRANRDNIAVVLVYTLFVTRFTFFSLGGDLGTGTLKAGLDLVPLAMIYVAISQVPRRNRITNPTSLPPPLGVRST